MLFPCLNVLLKASDKNANIFQTLGLDAFKLFEITKWLYSSFSLCFGGALQLTNAYGDVFLDEFSTIQNLRNLSS
jgi:NHS family xanthosine MFS transporter